MHAARSVVDGWDNVGVDPTTEEIQAALARVVGSPQFSGAERLRRFLTFVVETAIAGRADELKEFVVATAVFDRDQTYDPRLDAVVRVEAGRLRSRLAEYYADGGVADLVMIRVPKGGYAPVFERRSTPAIGHRGLSVTPSGTRPMPEAEPILEVAPPLRPTAAVTRVAGLLAVAVALVAGATATWYASVRAPMAAIPSASLAVLPLDDDGGGAVAESLSRALVGTGAVDVVAHGRVRDAIAQGHTASQIAQAFQAAYTVEGHVEARDGQLTIELVLIDARTARKVWVQSFTGDSSARDAVVRETASAVAAAIANRR